ncbi:FAD-dependent monooxygenase [Variovorax dokdonensis]|uniref:FAD-dependent monooxygenase n=1 Tax=Variovorax dokdonensis TaxID=344883 RepID=A0ABT7N5F1_9BURK|nr:FAD-dependent monooxygenase [Variovorax dokdonensis]MDM0043100.1 FAD-dependent monooxygenase [Variovorax dokdonensis]
MALPPEVCIRGAGIVGRALALLLAGARVRVALVTPEQDREARAREDIRAYALNDASRRLLESLRAWPDDMHVTAVREMQIRGDADGSVQFKAADHHVDALAWIADVPALEQRLADAVRFQPLVDVVKAPVAAPLTIVCEGRASATREALGVNYEVTRYPQQAIAARFTAEQPHGEVARQWFNHRGEVLALLPLGGTGGHEVALVWSVELAHAARLMALDETAFATEVAEGSGNALGALTPIGERAAWPLQRAIADRWTGHMPDDERDSWALAGDAAHTVHPLAGQGLNLGLADARALADVIATREHWRSVGDLRLLRRYERARRGEVMAMSLATDGLQQLFAHGAEPLPRLRNLGMTGFNRTRLLKSWVARQAMGLPTAAPRFEFPRLPVL